MKALVIGAGMMGTALAYDLAHSEGVEEITVADIDAARAKKVAEHLQGPVRSSVLDVHSYDNVVELMESADVAIGATSYTHNILLTQAAIEARCHFCDLGGNMDVVYRQMGLDAKAKQAGVTILPNCGLAPGFACVVAAGAAKRFFSLDAMSIRVGGLPQHPKPPLNYQLVFSAEGLINEYLEPAEVIREGKLRAVESMADLETLRFPAPFGKLEAFNTSGGVSTLTRMFDGKVQSLDYKTIRYPGHCEKFKTLLELGFASSEPIMAGNSVRTAREFFEELLRRKLPSGEPDAVLMRVTVTGIINGATRTLSYEMVDYSDEESGMTSMMRTTAFPTSIMAQMASRGAIPMRGVAPPEQCVPMEPLLQELKKRNIIIQEALH